MTIELPAGAVKLLLAILEDMASGRAVTIGIFSELTFLVDSWSWLVGQVPIVIRAIALAIGKYVSGTVGGYREFVHGLVAMLHLPQIVYDVAGVASFSFGRGVWIDRKVQATIACTAG
jgi:hypothetical protein